MIEKGRMSVFSPGIEVEKRDIDERIVLCWQNCYIRVWRTQDIVAEDL